MAVVIWIIKCGTKSRILARVNKIYGEATKKLKWLVNVGVYKLPKYSLSEYPSFDDDDGEPKVTQRKTLSNEVIFYKTSPHWNNLPNSQ